VDDSDDTPRLERLLARLNRLIDLDRARNIVVLGCGPRSIWLNTKIVKWELLLTPN